MMISQLFFRRQSKIVSCGNLQDDENWKMVNDAHTTSGDDVQIQNVLFVCWHILIQFNYETIITDLMNTPSMVMKYFVRKKNVFDFEKKRTITSIKLKFPNNFKDSR